jgi:hypothetical protein
MFIVLALLALGAAAKVTFAWTDGHDDSTCGGLYRPDIWRHGGYCQDLMLSRLLTVIGLLAVAVLALVMEVHRRRAGSPTAPGPGQQV